MRFPLVLSKLSDSEMYVDDKNLTDVSLFNVFSFSFSDVCTKYQEAAKIVNLALTGIVSQCVSGAKIVDICQVRSFSFFRVLHGAMHFTRI